jgi:DNA/RNA-binding domain of Phe-tRNA-synthetase-like protein
LAPSPAELVPQVDDVIWQRFPSYRALSVVVRDVRPTVPAPPPAITIAPWCDAHVEAWHAAFRAFGSNPKRTAPSLDALLRRFRRDGGLPAIHPVVDAYNALCLRFGAPFGGEDLDRYQGLPRLTVAEGSETFDTVRDGQPVVDRPDPGEVVWRDDVGVTCRRWNWRQCRRTAVTDEAVNLWFVVDRLEPMPIGELRRAGEALVAALVDLSPGASGTVQLLEP